MSTRCSSAELRTDRHEPRAYLHDASLWSAPKWSDRPMPPPAAVSGLSARHPIPTAPGAGTTRRSRSSIGSPQCSHRSAPPAVWSQPVCKYEHLGTLGALLVAVGPGHQRHYHRKQVTALPGQVVGPARPGALQHAVFHQLLQASAQYVARQSKTSPELVEAGQPVEGVADDQQCPALTEDRECPSERAALTVVVAPKWHGASLDNESTHLSLEER